MKTGEELEHDARELDRALAKMSPREKQVFGNQLAALFKAATPQWPRPIPVTERLPEADVSVLAYFADGFWDECYFYGDEIVEDGIALANEERPLPHGITHWLPMPPKPE